MSDNMTFTADQSKLLKKLGTAIEQFYSSAMFGPVVQQRYAEVLAVSTELSEAFPEMSQTAREYYFAEFESDVEDDLSGVQLCLFRTILSLLAFENAETVSGFHNAHDSFYSDWSDTLSYSDDWDLERGSWKSDQ